MKIVFLILFLKLSFAMDGKDVILDRNVHIFRFHSRKLGFEDDLVRLETRWAAGASEDEIADAFPPELVQQVGYFGPPSGAAEAVQRLAQGLDLAIVRVIAARPGADAVLATMRACRPELVRGQSA